MVCAFGITLEPRTPTEPASSRIFAIVSALRFSVRSLKHLIELMTELERQKIGFQSLQESIDTTSPGGKLVFHIFGALAEFERNLIRDRTRAGLEAARARGKKGGRPRKLNEQQRTLAIELYNQKKYPIAEICRTVGISKPTMYAYLRQMKA